MKEKELRKMHRSIGIILALFIILQSLSGIGMSIEDVFGKYWGILHDIHYHFSYIGLIYRIVVGMGLVWMSLSGIMIYMKIRTRRKAPQS